MLRCLRVCPGLELYVRDGDGRLVDLDDTSVRFTPGEQRLLYARGMQEMKRRHEVLEIRIKSQSQRVIALATAKDKNKTKLATAVKDLHEKTTQSACVFYFVPVGIIIDIFMLNCACTCVCVFDWSTVVFATKLVSVLVLVHAQPNRARFAPRVEESES